MATILRRLVPLAAVAAVAAAAFAFSDDAGADAADGTTFYQGAGGGQPTYFFFDATDTADAQNMGYDGDPDSPQGTAPDVCSAHPELLARMGTQDPDSQQYACAELVNDCATPAAGRLLGITVAPGDDPSTVYDDSRCWSYPADVSIERSVPSVWLPVASAQDPVFDVTKGSTPAEATWNLDIAAPNGPKSGTQVRASHATVDGSVALRSLGVKPGAAAETASASFAYHDWSGNRRWAEVTTDDRWVTVSIADGLTMDPQVCLDSGICQDTKTLQYIGANGTRESATILPHM